MDHVVLERSEVAHSWRTRRASLRLLTPNWMTRLPGFAYAGDDPDGYLRAPEVARLIDDYAAAFSAPVVTGTTVISVRAAADGYVVATDRGTWHATTVVVATGAAAGGNGSARPGYRPDLSWLDVDVFDRRDRIVHGGGVTASPGLYLIGMPFLRRRRSTLIDGAGADALELATHLAGHLDSVAGRRTAAG